MKNSILLISDINPEDVLANRLAAIRIENFQVIVTRNHDNTGIEISVNNNGLSFHIRSIILNYSDQYIINFEEKE